MVQLIELQLENVKSIVSGRARLTEGVNFIYGPNGAGKSTILDALAFTLYGTDWLKRVRLRLADLVRVHSKHAIFRLKVRGIDGRIYIIQRVITPEKTIEGSTYVMTEDGKRVAAKDKEVTQFVEKVLNIPLSVFMELLYVRQGELRDILEVSKRTEVKLDRVLKIEALEKLKSECLREARRMIEAHIRKIEGKLSYLTDDIYRKKSELSSILREKETLKIRLEELAKKLEEIRKRKVELEQIIRRIDELKRRQREIETLLNAKLSEVTRLNQLASELESKVSKIETLESKLRELETKISYLEKARQKLEELNAQKTQIELEISKLEHKLKLRKHLERSREDYLREISQLERELSELEKCKDKLKLLEKKLSRLEKLRERQDQVRERIYTVKAYMHKIEEELKLLRESEKACPLCGRPLTREHLTKLIYEREQKLEKLKKRLIKLQEVSTKLEKLLSKYDKLKEEYFRLRERIEHEEKIRGRLADLRNRLEDIERELSELGGLEELAERLRREYSLVNAKIEEIEEKTRELEELKKQRENLLRELAESYQARHNYESVLQQLTQLSEEIEHLRNEHSKIMSEISLLADQENTYNAILEEEQKLQSEIDSLMGRIQAFEQQEQKLKADIEARLREKRELESELDKYISAHRFISKLIDVTERIKPVIRRIFLELLNQELNNMFLEVCHKTAFVGVRVTENYDIYVKRRDGVELHIETLSVGEKNLIALLFRYALAKIVLGYVPFFILDEPTEHLDDEHRRRIAQWIKDISNEVGMIVITSHVDAFETVADNIIRVELINEKGEATFRNA